MIFCVEDDVSSRELMVYTLKTAGYQARGFANAKEFWEAMKDTIPELIILDIMMPGEDGISVLKKLRSFVTTEDIPVIMATAKGTEYDKVIGLDLGADDYLAKPFGMMEMISRVKAVLRRSKKATAHQSLLTIGSIQMNTVEHTVRVDGEEVELTLKEYDLLHLFMTNPGKAFSREMLLAIVWNEDFQGESRTVDVHIGTLRTKLSDAGSMIKTVRGIGYRMEVPRES